MHPSTSVPVPVTDHAAMKVPFEASPSSTTSGDAAALLAAAPLPAPPETATRYCVPPALLSCLALGEVVAGVRARVQEGKLDRANVVGLLLAAPVRSWARERPSADAPARDAAAALPLVPSSGEAGDDDGGDDDVNRSKVAHRACASIPRARSLATHPAGAQRPSPGRDCGAGGVGVIIVPDVDVPLP